MQYKLSHIPLFKIVLPLIFGILFFYYFAFSFQYLFDASLLLLVVFMLVHFNVRNVSAKKITSILAYLCLFVLGGLLISQTKYKEQKNHFSKFEVEYAKGIIQLPLTPTAKSYKTIIAVHQLIDSNKQTHPCSGQLLVYLQKDSSLSTLEIGDEVLFLLRYNAIQAPKNVAEFNYKQFLEHKQIYQQQYIPTQNIVVTQKHKQLWWKRISYNISKYVRSILKKYIAKTENFALADGILLGNDDNIDRALYNTFSYTGILHILSVSGLHVGIVYLLLTFLLSFITSKSKQIRVLKFLFILGFIWLFTFVTGSSTACVRASVLFTLIHTGTIRKEYVSGLNLLAGAALIQIILQPTVVFDIGFQLSYLAMLGLFFFYKPIYALFLSSNYLLDKILQLWSASIAAQIFTLPLSIYYFGNFPTYFLLANLFAIPLSFLILWCCILLIPLHFISIIAIPFGKLISGFISLFIVLSKWTTLLPFGKLNNLYISKTQLILLLFAMLLVLVFVLKKQLKWMLMSCILMLIVIFVSYQYTIQEWKKEKIVLYAVKQNFVLGSHKNGNLILISKDSINDKDFSFSIQNSHRVFRIKNSKRCILDSTKLNSSYYYKNDLLAINNQIFYFLTKNNTRKNFEAPLQIDGLVLSDNCYLDADYIQKNFNYKHLIISGDNDNFHQRIFKKILDKNKLNYTDLNENSLVLDVGL